METTSLSDVIHIMAIPPSLGTLQLVKANPLKSILHQSTQLVFTDWRILPFSINNKKCVLFKGISHVYQTPNKVQRLHPGVYSTELRWEGISDSATGFYECRYNDSSRRNVAVQFYHMIVQEAQAPRLKQLDKKKKKKMTVQVKEGKDAQLECRLEEGAPTPMVSWFKVKHEFALIQFRFTTFWGILFRTTFSLINWHQKMDWCLTKQK